MNKAVSTGSSHQFVLTYIEPVYPDELLYPFEDNVVKLHVN